MATLPEGMDLSAGVVFEQQPSRTWFINKNTNRIQGEADGLAAVRQAVEIILNVDRFRWQIYRPYSGTLWDGLIGQDSGYVASELQRRIQEALSMDDRVLGISDFSCTINEDKITAEFAVNTVYGDTTTGVEVNLS